MSAHFFTKQSQSLLKQFDDRIKQTEPKGKITTWMKVGNDYTHMATDWTRKAFFRPSIKDDRLVFNIIRREGQSVDTEVYAYYHGHLIETFIRHFSSSFSSGSGTARPDVHDNVTPA